MTPVVYLHGFASSPASQKARFFGAKLAERGQAVTIPDLAAGDFEHLTITGQLKVIDDAVGGRPAILLGSSLGGYLAALYAARHPQVERLVLMAPAFCFARRLPSMLGKAGTAEWMRTGWTQVFHYGEGRERALSYDLMKDSLGYEDYPRVSQPTLVLHGTQDDVVPLALSEAFVRDQPNARLVPIASGHEMTDSMDRLWVETIAFLNAPKG